MKYVFAICRVAIFYIICHFEKYGISFNNFKINVCNFDYLMFLNGKFSKKLTCCITPVCRAEQLPYHYCAVNQTYELYQHLNNFLTVIVPESSIMFLSNIKKYIYLAIKQLKLYSNFYYFFCCFM